MSYKTRNFLNAINEYDRQLKKHQSINDDITSLKTFHQLKQSQESLLFPTVVIVNKISKM